jgi:hypothetical protein
MVENRNVAVMDDLEVIMRPQARLSKGMVAMMQANAKAEVKVGKGPDG